MGQILARPSWVISEPSGRPGVFPASTERFAPAILPPGYQAEKASGYLHGVAVQGPVVARPSRSGVSGVAVAGVFLASTERSATAIHSPDTRPRRPGYLERVAPAHLSFGYRAETGPSSLDGVAVQEPVVARPSRSGDSGVAVQESSRHRQSAPLLPFIPRDTRPRRPGYLASTSLGAMCSPHRQPTGCEQVVDTRLSLNLYHVQP